MDGERGKWRTIPRPLEGHPLLYVPGGKGLVVAADIHVGLVPDIGYDRGAGRGDGVFLAEEILRGMMRVPSRRLLILGDVKEPIVGGEWRVRREVGRFFTHLREEGVDVEVVKGNHDVGLERMAPDHVTIHPSRGVLKNGIGYFHGHAWPSQEILLGARVLVAGHLHPGVLLADGRKKCWVRVSPRNHGPSLPIGPHIRRVIVVPAFNPLCSSESLNVEKPRRSRSFLVRRFLSPGESRAYLVDGTDLGNLPV